MMLEALHDLDSAGISADEIAAAGEAGRAELEKINTDVQAKIAELKASGALYTPEGQQALMDYSKTRLEEARGSSRRPQLRLRTRPRTPTTTPRPMKVWEVRVAAALTAGPVAERLVAAAPRTSRLVSLWRLLGSPVWVWVGCPAWVWVAFLGSVVASPASEAGFSVRWWWRATRCGVR